MIDFLEQKEKKVEYIELIYDLIFVYVICRNNMLLHHFSGGFVELSAFGAYVLTTLAAIQIWNFTTYYVNIFGRNGAREHVFLFINMFLLYFMGEGTRGEWEYFHTQYHTAWALILVNLAVQYLIELRNHDEEKNRSGIIPMAAILLTEAALVALSAILYRATGAAWLSLGAILFGMQAVLLFGQRKDGTSVDFPHLSERAMLYVVFTFGEMIIGTSSYFSGFLSLRDIYFALMAFLIVAGLFLSYEVFYDRIIDREKNTNGLGYILLHIFLIFAMNNITSSLEFMQEPEVNLLPKVLFLILSLLLYFACLFALGNRHAVARCEHYHRFCLRSGALGGVFVALMLIFRREMALNIALTVCFVFAMFLDIYRYSKSIRNS